MYKLFIGKNVAFPLPVLATRVHLVNNEDFLKGTLELMIYL